MSGFFFKIIFSCIIYCIFAVPYLVCWESFGRFIDKIFSFPYMREGCDYNIKNYECLTYEGFIVNLLYVMVALSLSFLIGFEFNLIIVAVCFTMLFPAILLFLRIHTFSDDNILPETETGYAPFGTWFLSMFGSTGLYMIFPAFFGSSEPLYFFVTVLILGLSATLVPIFPDYINKLLPFEIRTEKGVKLLIVITFILWLSLWIFVIGYYISTGASPSELMPARFGGS